jgi:hypothetical protein
LLDEGNGFLELAKRPAENLLLNEKREPDECITEERRSEQNDHFSQRNGENSESSGD